MLTQIHLQNFAIVKSLSLDFALGNNVLTGETGAGKSIWVDAIGLALGARADAQCIGPYGNKTDICLCFDISQQADAQQWLSENDFNSDAECIIRRIINSSGTNKSSINGIPCTLSQLKALGEHLVQIHSQHQHQRLLKKDYQRIALDRFADNATLLQAIQNDFRDWQSLEHEKQTLIEKAQRRDQELAFLKYQADELSQLDLQTNEWQELSSTHTKLHNAKQLMQQINQAIHLTIEHEEYSAAQLIQQALTELQMIKLDDEQISTAIELLNTASIHLQEAGDGLNHYRNHLDLSPEHLNRIETRLSAIHELARKHHTDPKNLVEVYQSLQQKISDLELAEEKLQAIATQQQALVDHYQTIAKKLTQRRQKSAKKLHEHITQQMQQLGIKGGEFAIELTNIDAPISAYGNEQIQFIVKTNPQQALQPMHKIVSGGELSRISLALQVAIAEKDHTPTLIFDEVDVGISGKTAAIVGELLRQLAQQAQVLCITHLPQVAALGEHHYQVVKDVSATQSTTSIKKLSKSERIQELARMLGGSKITKQTMAHAEEMLV